MRTRHRPLGRSGPVKHIVGNTPTVPFGEAFIAHLGREADAAQRPPSDQPLPPAVTEIAAMRAAIDALTLQVGEIDARLALAEKNLHDAVAIIAQRFVARL